MEKYEFCKPFEIKYCDVDFKDALKPSALLAYLEEVSCLSADELGFGYTFIKERGYAFIVTGYRCEFKKPIPLGELAHFKTWPTPPSHVIFGREYQVLSNAGDVLVNATSRWCLIDIEKGKILPSKVLEGQDYSTYNTTKLFPDWRPKIPAFSKDEGELKFTITIANSEYDHNMHVNNTRYADYCFNCFSVSELSQKRLKEFSINYVKQCKERQTLRFYLKKDVDGAYLAHGFNEENEVVVQSQIYFEE